MEGKLEVALLSFRPLCICHVNAPCLHNESSEVCIKASSSPASLPFKTVADPDLELKGGGGRS